MKLKGTFMFLMYMPLLCAAQVVVGEEKEDIRVIEARIENMGRELMRSLDFRLKRPGRIRELKALIFREVWGSSHLEYYNRYIEERKREREKVEVFVSQNIQKSYVLIFNNKEYLLKAETQLVISEDLIGCLEESGYRELIPSEEMLLEAREKGECLYLRVSHLLLVDGGLEEDWKWYLGSLDPITYALKVCLEEFEDLMEEESGFCTVL